MSFVCPVCSHGEFWTHGDEELTWYVDGDGNIMDSGDYHDSHFTDNYGFYCAQCEKEFSAIPPKEDPVEEWLELQKPRYVARHGAGCPLCYSKDIEGGSIDADSDTAWQHCSCGNCGAEWNDIYQLKTIEMTNVPDDAVPEEVKAPPEPDVPDPNEAFKEQD